MNSVFSSLSIIKEIQCLAVSLLYHMSENDNLDLSCITTTVNETFHGKLKSHLQGDKTVLQRISSPGNFILCVKGDTSVIE